MQQKINSIHYRLGTLNSVRDSDSNETINNKISFLPDTSLLHVTFTVAGFLPTAS